VPVTYLLPALAATPDLVADADGRIPEGARTRPTHEGRFTPNEVLAHLADWEPIFYARMVQAVAEPGSVLQVWDEGERAEQMGYAEMDPSSCLEAYRRSRAETVAWLHALPDHEWAKSALHPERGTLTVADLAVTMLGHDVYHVKQLLEVAD
jgi:hypothetical protein